MVVSLGCEKLQPERLMPPGTIPLIRDERGPAEALDLVCLQDDAHVGFMSMVESIMRHRYCTHLERLNAPPPRHCARPANWWWACSAAAATRFQRRHGQPGGGLLPPTCWCAPGPA